MDKSCHTSGESTTTSTSNSDSNTTRDEYLRHLNKISHRISKPIVRRNPHPHPLDPNLLLLHPRPPPLPPQPPPPPPPPPPLPPPLQLQNNLPPPPPHQHQPPVYNINKSDFRDVVQKLTGSPAHERFSTPPPIHPPKPQSSRLQRIRPPPLSALGNRPPPPYNANAAVVNPNIPHIASVAPPPPVSGGNFTANSYRQVTPLSPLPPFPSVHGAVESPISAYMRYLQGSISSDSDPKQLSRHSPLISPRWNNSAQPPQQQQIPPPLPLPPPSSSSSMFSSQLPMMPTSPLPFGCLPSPRSPYALLSPSILFSPSTGQLGFPTSPRLPVPSPRWRDR